MSYMQSNIIYLHETGQGWIATKMELDNVTFPDKVKLFFSNIWRKSSLHMLTAGGALSASAICASVDDSAKSEFVRLFSVFMWQMGLGFSIISIDNALNRTTDLLLIEPDLPIPIRPGPPQA